MTVRPARPAALVTGAARRVGRAIVEDLACHGLAVGIHYGASKAEAESLADDINSSGGEAATVGGDLADPVLLIAEAARRALGPLTLLVNNAALYEGDTIGKLDRDLWDRQLAINLAAPVFLSEAFSAQLPKDAEGNIVNLLDPRIFRPTPDYFSYQISKSALFAATITLAKALAPQIRVNGIAPGPVLPSSHTTPDRFARRIATLPLKRQPDLSDFGRTIRYFVENRSITGQVIALDSGQSLA